jgi:hypothetical protein
LGALVATVALSAGAGASAAIADTADETPATVTSVTVPAPGHSSSWNMRLTNPGSSPATAAVTILAEDGQLLTGQHAPRLALVDAASGRTILRDVPLAELGDTSLPVATVNAADTLDMTATISMPREAGNEYQGQSQSVTFRFTTVAASFEDPLLASTGMAAMLPLAIALLLVLFGFLALVLRRKKRAEAEQ